MQFFEPASFIGIPPKEQRQSRIKSGRLKKLPLSSTLRNRDPATAGAPRFPRIKDLR